MKSPSIPDLKPALLIASKMYSTACSFSTFGAKPPSSPTDVAKPLAFKIDFNEWNTSAVYLKASLNEGAPTGITINSWKSTLLSACFPPFKMFAIGTGSVFAKGPPKYV